MSDFYLTLPSSTENSKVQNTLSVFTTRLPQVLSLEKDKWVVAATDIIYPYSYKNVNKVLKYYIHFKDGRQPLCFDIPANQYNTSEQVLTVLNRKSRKRRSIQAAVDVSAAQQLADGFTKKTIEEWRDFFLYLLGIMTYWPVDKESTLSEQEKTVDDGQDETEESVNGEKEHGAGNVPDKETDDGKKIIETIVVDSIGDTSEKETDDSEEITKTVAADSESKETEGETGNETGAVNDKSQIIPSDNIFAEALKNHFEDLLKLKISDSTELKDALTQVFTKHFERMEELRKDQSNALQKLFTNALEEHASLKEAMKNTNNDPKILKAITDQMTERETSFINALRQKDEGFNNLAESIENAIKQQLGDSKELQYKALIPIVDDSNLEELTALRETMRPKTIQAAGDFVQFKLEDDILQVNIKDSNVSFIELDKECAYFLGFHTCIAKDGTRAISGIDFFGNVSTLYVYCDVVDQTIVGNSKSSLLTVVPCKGKYGEMVQHTFPVPRYLPLMNGTIDSIKVQVLSEFGDRINFNWGSTIITLHFRKIA